MIVVALSGLTAHLEALYEVDDGRSKQEVGGIDCLPYLQLGSLGRTQLSSRAARRKIKPN